MDGNDRHADARSWNLTPGCLFNFETRCVRSESTQGLHQPPRCRPRIHRRRHRARLPQARRRREHGTEPLLGLLPEQTRRRRLGPRTSAAAEVAAAAAATATAAAPAAQPPPRSDFGRIPLTPSQKVFRRGAHHRESLPRHPKPPRRPSLGNLLQRTL